LVGWLCYYAFDGVALQLAKKCLKAGEVATTASSQKAALCRSLGADIVIDYHREKFESRLENYDVALDLVAEPTRTMGILRPNGVCICVQMSRIASY
jgi:NADPH:quinone reductase-like Zn-dependent oxidoreductase